jgi:hypothetical protein
MVTYEVTATVAPERYRIRYTAPDRTALERCLEEHRVR